MTVVGDLALSLSNLFFLIPFAEAVFYRHRWTRAFVYLLLTFTSGIYHACYSSMRVCILDPATHQDLDFFLSYLLIPLSALYFVDFRPRWAFIERWLIMSFALAIFILRVQVPWQHHTIVEVSLVGVSLLIVLVYFAYHGEQTGKLPPYNWGYVALGLSLVLVSFAFFVWSDHLGGYDVAHSLWHILAAFGQLFILRIKQPAEQNAAIDAKITSQFTYRSIPKL